MDNTITSAAIMDETATLLDNLNEQKENIGLLKIKAGNQWLKDASKRPIPEDLWQKLWFQSEICILFADTNLGKSILAVQMAVDISARHKVIYIDFELSDKQFEARYSNNYEHHFTFPDNFLRAEINTDEADYTSYGFKNIEDYLANSIENAINETGARILIIDNLTYLRTETEKAKDALPLMKYLKQLKSKYDLSLLCLAHTPKRDMSKPISRNDLSGSKMLINFCDSAFAIGESTQEKSLRYIKQIKVRNTEFIYDSENVAMYRIEKPDNFLRFEFAGYSYERMHLKQMTEKDKEALKGKIIERMSAPGATLRKVANELGVDHMKVSRTWDEYKAL
jgi:KaiC/GvpD/RAD55 family RecA-like ATPase